MHQRIEQDLAGKTSAREQPGEAEGYRQRHRDCHRADLERQRDDPPFLRRKHPHRRPDYLTTVVIASVAKQSKAVTHGVLDCRAASPLAMTNDGIDVSACRSRS